MADHVESLPDADIAATAGMKPAWLDRVLNPPPPPFMGPDSWYERGQIAHIALHDTDLEFRSLACWEIQRRQQKGRPYLRFHDGSGQRAQEARNWTLSSALEWRNDAMKGMPRETAED